MNQRSFRRSETLPLGIRLIAVTVGVMAGLRRLFLTQSSQAHESPTDTPKVQRKDYFEIRRTQSELGYTYWVLQGVGKFQGVALFDTWQEAMDEARSRAANEVEPLPSTAAARFAAAG
jgi:hypothetical protein